MDRERALAAYVQAIIPEREDYLRQRAMQKVRPITRGMSEQALQEYLDSKAFATAL